MAVDAGQRKRILAALRGLNDVRADILASMAEVIATPLTPTVNPGSWLLTPTWVETFTTLLQVHHGYSSDAMSGSAFENAFVAACRSTGWSVAHNESRTQRFVDATLKWQRKVGPRPAEPYPKTISLKTSSAKAMSRKTIHISKLTEGAFIQDMRTDSSRRPRILALFTAYSAATDAIFILRGFRFDDRIEYELAEIPTAMFAQISSLPLRAFTAGTIDVPQGQMKPDFRVRVDKSDAKFTLTGVNIELCTIHADWIVTVRPVVG